ncbi:MAG: hypothetical protein QOI06_493 [Nocardioidaceae bacterium]|jgi:hypothetical protein|nr:hypothetical protein [Nocardioidaceae bacterium]
MAPSDRRPRWRRAVYAQRPEMTNGCRVVLLYLADNMNAKGVVSTPRNSVADALGVQPQRITEAIQLGRRLGFLDIVKRARQHVTAVYQATIPADPEVRHGVPLTTQSEVRQGAPLPADPEVRHGVPLTADPEVRKTGGHRGTAGRTPNDAPEVRHSPTPSSGYEPQTTSPPADPTSKDAVMTGSGSTEPQAPSSPDDGDGHDDADRAPEPLASLPSESRGTVTDAPLPQSETQPHQEPPEQDPNWAGQIRCPHGVLSGAEVDAWAGGPYCPQCEHEAALNVLDASGIVAERLSDRRTA